MSEWTTGVKTSVTAIVLLIIISIVIGIAYMSSRHIDENTDNINAMIYSHNASEFVKYDGLEVCGTEVLNAIENYKEYCILVKYPSNSSYCMAFNKGIADSSWSESGRYSKTVLPDTAVLKDVSSGLRISYSADSDNYINPSARFRANLLKSQNGVIIGLTFSHLF